MGYHGLMGSGIQFTADQVGGQVKLSVYGVMGYQRYGLRGLHLGLKLDMPMYSSSPNEAET